MLLLLLLLLHDTYREDMPSPFSWTTIWPYFRINTCYTVINTLSQAIELPIFFWNMVPWDTPERAGLHLTIFFCKSVISILQQKQLLSSAGTCKRNNGSANDFFHYPVNYLGQKACWTYTWKHIDIGEIGCHCEWRENAISNICIKIKTN